MVIKSLTITEEAYNALKTLKYNNESFSEVILRLSKEKIGLVSKYFGVLKSEEGKNFELRVKKNRVKIEKDFMNRTKHVRGSLL